MQIFSPRAPQRPDGPAAAQAAGSRSRIFGDQAPELLEMGPESGEERLVRRDRPQ
jgi:hypothetical protein